MGFILVLILAVVAYSFYEFAQHRKSVVGEVTSRGGVSAVYADFVSFFTDKGFRVRELTSDSIYLHYGTSIGKVGVQLIVVGHDKAEVIMSEEMATGHRNDANSSLGPGSNQKEVARSTLGRLRFQEQILSLPPA